MGRVGRVWYFLSLDRLGRVWYPDMDKMGKVSLREFIEIIQRLSKNDDDAILAFLFQVQNTLSSVALLF